jgi:ATP-dependent DNA helicase RecQ
VCLGWGRRRGRALAEDELLAVRIALSAVGRLSGRFGVERVAQVLVGSRSREVVSRGLDRVPTYGKLAAISLDEVKDLLGALADQGLIERHGIEGARPGAFVLALTAMGRAVALGKIRPSLELPPARAAAAAPKGSAVPERPADPELLARLKAWRTEEARRRQVPSYVVFHDSTLAAVAAARPHDAETLLAVKGVGPAKLEAYGAAVLRLVRPSSDDRGVT